MKQRVLGCVLAVLCAAGGAAAQQGTSEVRGRVLDSQGAVLPGVAVTIRNQDTGMFRETVSNDDGTYFVSGVVPGPYEISAELQGFKKYARRDVRLEVGKTTTVDVPMEVGSLEETVTVAAESPLVDITSKEVGGHISSRELVELPSVNRNFVGFVGLLPGIIPSISTESFGSDSVTVNGQDPRNNNYMLDGANNNDDVIGQRAGTQARTPIEAVQEFQVITNQFDAEFGRTNGAIINAVTKQGTNAFRGSAFLFAQDASMTAKDYFAKKNELDKPDTSQMQWGGTLGGPVVKDRAHFFGSLERVTIDEGITVNVPARPEFNATTTEATRVWNTIARFDHQLNAGNTWGVRWLREYSPQYNQIIGAVTLGASREEDDLDQTVVGTVNTVFGNTRVNTLRLGWTQEDVSFGNPCFNGNGRNQAACAPTLAFSTFTDQQNATAQARVNDAFQIENTMSWFLPGKAGDHDVKLGVQYQYAQSENSTQDNSNGTFSFGLSNGPFNASDPRTYPERFSIRVPGPGGSFNKSSYVAAFIQDKWKLNGRLTLSLGLRYDLEMIPIPEIDNPLFSDPNDAPMDKNNVQPRVGIAYDVDGRSVARGGYGRFYDKTHFELIGGIYTATVFATSFNRNFPLANNDPGPRTGQFPTDPFLVNGPTITDAMRAELARLFPAGQTIRNTGNVSWDNPDRRMSYTDQFTVGYERQLGSNLSASADYVRARTRDMLISRELNPNLRSSTTVAGSTLARQGSDLLRQATATLASRYPGFANFGANVTIPVNAGSVDYDAVLLQLEKRFSNNFSSRVSYTYSRSHGNNSGAGIPGSGFQVLDDLHLELNEGPTSQDVPHNLVVSGSVIIPRTGGLSVSGVVRALSGSPFSLTNSNFDADRNGSQSEPLPAGTYSGTGADSYTVEGYESQRNGARGPGFFKADVRLSYNLNLRGRRVELIGEVFNITDRVNFSNPTGNQANADFLRLTGYSTSTTPRLVQLGARLVF